MKRLIIELSPECPLFGVLCIDKENRGYIDYFLCTEGKGFEPLSSYDIMLDEGIKKLLYQTKDLAESICKAKGSALYKY